MTVVLSGTEIAAKLEKQFPGGIVESDGDSVVVNSQSLLEIASFLKTAAEFQFNYLTVVTAVDYRSYFEVVYGLTSLVHNHSLVLKVRVSERDNPVLPSVVGLWRGGDVHEREIYYLMGITFEGYPDLKRIVLWGGFPGYPLRKDFNDAG